MSENKWAKAAQASTQEGADMYFKALLFECQQAEPYRDADAVKETVVANILWMAGYYDNIVNAGRLYAHKSPYRR